MNLTAFCRVLIVFFFVLSVSFNVKFYLDNQVLVALLIDKDNGLDSEGEVKQLVEDIHLLKKMDLNSSLLKDENSSEGAK